MVETDSLQHKTYVFSLLSVLSVVPIHPVNAFVCFPLFPSTVYANIK